MLTCRDRRSI